MPEKACLRRQSPRRSNAGIFWVNSGPLNTTLLPYPDYVKWYEGIHIPDWMGAKKDAISTGWRFQCEDEDRKQPFLVVYRYANISDTNAPEFRSVPLGHPSLPGGGPIPRLANFAAISGQNTEAWRSARIGADGTRITRFSSSRPDASQTPNEALSSYPRASTPDPIPKGSMTGTAKRTSSKCHT